MIDGSRITTKLQTYRYLLAGAILLLGLFWASIHSYLLFHSIVEILSIVVASGVFMIAWNSRRFAENHYLIFLGIAFFPVAAIDLLHTLAYKGMGIFPAHDANLPTQLWIAARYLQSLSFLVAPLFIPRQVRWGWVLFAYTVLFTLLLLSIFYWRIFPVCYVEGVGLTSFKRISEYLIALILVAAIFLLLRQRERFDEAVLRLLVLALGISIVSEVSFSIYVSVYGLANFIGHLLKAVAFYLIYLALIEANFIRPYSTLFRDLRQSEEELRKREQHQRFLAQAGALLSSSFDYEATLQRLAQLAVPTLADWCFVDLIEEKGTFRRVAVAHADPAKKDVADRLQHRYNESLDAPHGVSRVLKHHQTEMIPVVDDAMLASVTQDEEYLALLRAIGIRSYIVAPLIARGRLLGALSFMMAASCRTYGPEDERLAEDLAQHAAILIDNVRLYQQAQDANRFKDQFVAVVSHELRNPLAAIQTGVSVLQQSLPHEGRIERVLEIIDRNTTLQARLVNDLLDISRITQGKLHLEMAPVALDQVVRAAVLSVQSNAEQARLHLQWQTEPDLFVQGDVDRLQQIVLNLLTNAIKFTPAGGTVNVSLSRVDHTARIVVEDTGIGISPELLPHLFELFRQGDASGQRKPGLGIGLSLVKSLTELHGGRVWVESAGEGKGSRFTVELPLSAAPATALPEGNRGEPEAGARIQE